MRISSEPLRNALATAEYRPWLEIIDSEIRSTLNADISA
jgi:hypothetical protein